MTTLTLSSYQKDIIAYLNNQKGNLLINAVAGSGKTTMLLMLLENIPSDKDALLCAFNVKIAETLQERITKKGLTNATALNIHKLGFRLITSAYPTVKKWVVKGDKSFKLIEDICTQYPCFNLEKSVEQIYYSELKEFCRLCYLKLFSEETPKDELENLIEAYGLHNLKINFDYAWQTFLDYLQRTLSKIEKGYVCFNDMIAAPNYLGLSSSVKYPFILVDECQDLNNAQLDIVLAYVNKKSRLFFVGDKKQAIYGFTGSNNNNFELIAEKIGNSNELPLSVCYRCGKEIVKYSQKYNPDILPYEEKHSGKVIETNLDDLIEIIKSQGYTGKNKVFLARKNSQLIKMFFYLLRLKLPAYVNGRDLGKNLEDFLGDLSKSVNFESLPDYLNSQECLLREQNKFTTQLEDKFECLRVIAGECTSYQGCFTFIQKLTKLNINENALELSSIHKSKGQEYSEVYLLTEHLPLTFPNQQDWQYEQEINLAYVACTRAIDTLYLLDSL